MYLHESNLMYGDRPYPVKDHEMFGIPEVFDFSNPERCARAVLAGMSQASGGHPLRDCRVLYHTGRHTATVTANGAAVHYRPRTAATKLTAEQAMSILNQTVRLELGTVYPPGRAPQARPQNESGGPQNRRWRAR